ncbi:cytochrome c peroxidase [Prosthecobacter fusiformis]|uniref:Cytochrome c peroxidase n=1 Tax=Prosthecobacter fusiformis TaxID=48464 RepID=A0A4R7RYZ1_9BACT|nr:cytochrome c peroxidase [Prosthecobacter fusiformis]TDU70599.1 cytochrome c peroxidase [Prosthecobacter fusiformis]
MKVSLALCTLLSSLPFAATAGSGILDLTTQANYAQQGKPAYITRDNTTDGKAITDRGATLGRVLFYDKRLSKDDSISCSSCHQQAHAFSDTSIASTGVNGTTGRHSMRLINSRFSQEPKFFWDERATTLENQTTQPIRDHAEMGFSGTGDDPAFSVLLTKLAAIEEYQVLFAMAFGDTAITESRLQLALAQFIRSIQSFDSRFDVGRAQVANGNAPFPNFTTQENAGKQIFLTPPPNGAGCAGCHRPGEFDIDPASRNNGVTTKIGGGTDLTNVRSPSLRDLIGPGGQSNGPFMHDGSLATLEAVINHYNAIPADNDQLDARLQRPNGQPQNLGLTQDEKDSLLAFLLTLTGSAVYTDERWSDPFDEAGQLSLIVFPATAIKIEKSGAAMAKVSCQATPGLQYKLQASTDLVNWDTTIATVTADANGLCQHQVSLTGSWFYRYAYEVPSP